MKTKQLLFPKNIAACLKFAKEHLDVPHHYLPNILWMEERKKETLTSELHPNCEIWQRGHYGLWLLCCLRDLLDCFHYQENEFPNLVRHFAGKLETISLTTALNRLWVLQQDIDPKHRSKSTTEWP